MPGPLSSIFAALAPIITANMASSGIAPAYGVGGGDRAAEGAPPRIVWVPTTEDIGPARGQGGDVVLDSLRSMNLPGGAQAPLFTRISNIECDIWGADRDMVETMINSVVSAVHDSMTQGSYGIQSGRWLLPDEVVKDGEVYRLVFLFQIPIVRVLPGVTTAVITSIPETTQILPIVGS